MRCSAARRALRRRFEGTLSIERALELDHHLATCASCAHEAATQDALGEVFEGLRQPPVDRVDVDASLRAIHAALEGAAETPRVRATPSRGPRRVAAVLLVGAAAAVVAGFLFLDRTPRRPGTEGDAEIARPEPTLAPIAADTVEEETAAPKSEVDHQRLFRARADVRTAIATHLDVLVDEGSVSYADAVDESLAALDAEDWPVERLVAGFTRPTEAEGVELAIGALRYLGRRPSRSALADVQEALERPELARAAVDSLADAGAQGRERLVDSAWTPGLASQVLARVLENADVSANETVTWVRDAFDAYPRRGSVAEDTAERLLEALSGCGRSGAELAVELIQHPAVEIASVVDVLARSTSGEEVVANALAARPSRLSDETLFRVLERVQPEGTLEWLERRLDDPAARTALAHVPGVRAARLFVEHWPRSPRASDSSAAARALALDAARFEELVNESATSSEWIDERALFDLLLAANTSDAVRPLLGLVAAGTLPDDERQLAALAVRELGGPEHEPWIRHALARLATDARADTLAAALVVALHGAAGDAAALSLFAEFGDEEDARALLELLREGADQGRPTLTVLRLARHTRFLKGLQGSIQGTP